MIHDRILDILLTGLLDDRRFLDDIFSSPSMPRLAPSAGQPTSLGLGRCVAALDLDFHESEV